MGIPPIPRPEGRVKPPKHRDRGAGMTEPPKSKWRRVKLGPLIYTSEKIPGAKTHRRITWHALIKWDNQR